MWVNHSERKITVVVVVIIITPNNYILHYIMHEKKLLLTPSELQHTCNNTDFMLSVAFSLVMKLLKNPAD